MTQKELENLIFTINYENYADKEHWEENLKSDLNGFCSLRDALITKVVEKTFEKLAVEEIQEFLKDIRKEFLELQDKIFKLEVLKVFGKYINGDCWESEFENVTKALESENKKVKFIRCFYDYDRKALNFFEENFDKLPVIIATLLEFQKYCKKEWSKD